VISEFSTSLEHSEEGFRGGFWGRRCFGGGEGQMRLSPSDRGESGLRLGEVEDSDPEVRLESYSRERDRASYSFSGFREMVIARVVEEVRPAIEAVEQAVEEGYHAAGYVSYEASAGLDDALTTRDTGGIPLVWFGIFSSRDLVEPGSFESAREYKLSPWEASITRSRYEEKIQQIRAYIKAGDTYQVNFTFRMRAKITGCTRSLYGDLCEKQKTPYSAFVDTGDHQILSASPELFFSLQNGKLVTRPMKGTGRRGRWSEENDLLVSRLEQSPKDRAENLMIVDLLRNDLGRISKTGSVEVTDLWEVEQYETVNQMTSTITSELREDERLVDVFTSLFPCGSVTGAPKKRTMEIISDLESSPRGVYTGCVGYVSPGLEARFNVAIRTVVIDKSTGEAEFGVGGGITYDSAPEDEYGECLLKAEVLATGGTQFQLFETLRREETGSYFLLNRHLDRLERSSQFFGFSYDRVAVAKALEELVTSDPGKRTRVRLTLSRAGEIQVEEQPLGNTPDRMRAGFASSPVNSQDRLLFHKTTERAIFEAQRAEHPDWDEVILFNERGEITECCRGNMVVCILGEYVTPPVECGLLPGTFRAELIDRGELTEGVLHVGDVKGAEKVFMVNSVRDWVPLEIVN